jgi:iron complex transport system substrate-binding protein
MEAVGATGSVDLERVAALRPDLIFHATDYQQIPVDTLAALAPTIVYPRAPAGLLEPLRWLGSLLDRAERADQLERELRAVFDARRAEVGLAGLRVAVVNLVNYDASTVLGVAGPGSNIGEFAALLGGVVTPESVGGAPLTSNAEVSLELMPTALADAEFVLAMRYGGSAENDRRFDASVADPLWRSVPAVARGQVAYLDIQEAGGNIGLDGLRAALDDLAAQVSST